MAGDDDDTEADRRSRRGSGFDLLGIFSNFGIPIILLAAICYFVARTQFGQNLMRQLPAEWQTGLRDILARVGIDFTPTNTTPEGDRSSAQTLGGLTPEQAAAVIPTDTTEYARVQAIVHRVTGNNSVITGLQNEGVIFQLVRDEPAYMLRLVRSFAPAAGAQPQPNPRLREMLPILQRIIQDPAKLNVLLDSAHINNTLDILIAATGGTLPFRRDALATFITSVGMNNGTVTPAFQTFLQSMVTASGQSPEQQAATTSNAFIALLASPGMETKAAEIATFMRRVDASTIPEGQREFFQVLSNAATAAPTIQLLQTLERTPGTAARVLDLIQNRRGDEARQTPGLLPALLAWRDAVTPHASTLPPTLKALYDELRPITRESAPSLEAIQSTRLGADLLAEEPETPVRIQDYDPARHSLTQLSRADRLFYAMTHSSERAQLEQDSLLGRFGDLLRNSNLTDPSARMAATFLSARNGENRYGNLGALRDFFTAVGSHQANQNAESRDVLHAIYQLVQGNNEPFRNLDPEVTAAFFRRNHAVVHRLLERLDFSRLPQPYQDFFRYLNGHWDGQASTALFPAGTARSHGFREVFSSADGIRAVQEGMGGRWVLDMNLWDNYLFTNVVPDNSTYLSELGDLSAAIEQYNQSHNIRPSAPRYAAADASLADQQSPAAAPAAASAPSGVPARVGGQ